MIAQTAEIFFTSDAVTLVGAGGEGGMPQLDPTSFASQIFWLFVVFFLLYLVMKSLVAPRIGSAIALRQNQIEADIASAEALKKEAQEAEAAYEQAIASSRKEANALLAATQHEIEAAKTAAAKDMDAKIAKLATLSENKLLTVTDKFKAEALPLATSMVTEIVKKLGKFDADEKSTQSALSNLL